MDDHSNSNTTDLIPNEEAVAALSATLAFQGFDHFALKQDDEVGECNRRTSSSSSPLSSSSRDPHPAVRRLSRILGGHAAGIRRSSLDTILSSSSRGILRNGSGGQTITRKQPSRPRLFSRSTPTPATDDISLNPDDFLNNDGDEEEGSMTISLLEAKDPDSSWSTGKSSSGDDDTSYGTCGESIHFLEGEEFNSSTDGKKWGGGSARGLVSSVRKISRGFGNSFEKVRSSETINLSSSARGHHISLSSIKSARQGRNGQHTQQCENWQRTTKAGIKLSSPGAAAPEETVDLEDRGNMELGEAATAVATAGQQPQEDMGSQLAESKNPSVAPSNRLTPQEVEGYGARLERKRASMMEAEINQDDAGVNNEISTQEQAPDLNQLFLENATNISNASLLQRALFTLRIRNDDHDVAAIGGNPIINNLHPGEGGVSAKSNNASKGRGAFLRSNSEHTGLDRMALHHFLTLSSSGSVLNKSDNEATNAVTHSRHNANWNTAVVSSSSTATFNDNHPRHSLDSPVNDDPSSNIAGRRNTYREGRRCFSGRSAPEAPRRIGAYQIDEPAPLLFRRTFASTTSGRREARAEARSRIMRTLGEERRGRSMAEAERRGEVADADVFGSSSGSTVDARGLRSSNELSNYKNEGRMQQFSANENTARTAGASTGSATPPSSTSRTTTSGPGDEGAAATTNRSLDAPCAVTSREEVGLECMLQAPIRHNSVSSHIPHAILVSDEIFEADQVCTSSSMSFDDFAIIASLQERLAATEELLEERDTEQRDEIRGHRRREKLCMVFVIVLVIIVVATTLH